jgi:flagellar capping protein FliD
MQQTIIAEVKAAILKAIDSAHEAVQKGIGAAQKKLDEEKEDYDKRCRDAKARYDAEYAAFQAEIVSLEEKIIAQAKLAQVKRENASRVEKEERVQLKKKQSRDGQSFGAGTKELRETRG